MKEDSADTKRGSSIEKKIYKKIYNYKTLQKFK